MGKVDPSGEWAYSLSWSLIRTATVTTKDRQRWSSIMSVRNKLHSIAAFVAGVFGKGIGGVAVLALEVSNQTDWLSRWGIPKELSDGDVVQWYLADYAVQANGLIGPSAKYRVYGKVRLLRNSRQAFSKVYLAFTFRCKGKNQFIPMRWHGRGGARGGGAG